VRRALLTVAAVIAVATSGCGSSSHRTAAVDTAPTPTGPQLHGAVPSDPSPRPSFVLDDTAGRRYDFGARTRGQVTLLYAGYTHCPDECPTAMADIASALRRLPRDVVRQVDVVFVTTDPWRDTRGVLRRWLDRFHPPQPYVGLTGSPTEIAGAEAALHIPMSRREAAPKSYGSGSYAVSHFAAVLVYGRDDRLATLYPSGVTPADIAKDLQVLVKG
jgi:protein SCO1/2